MHTSWHLQFTRFGGLSMTVALRKSPRENIAEISYRHSPLSKSEPQQVYVPHNLKEKKREKPCLFRTRCSASRITTGEIPIKTTTRESNYTSQKDHLHKSTTVNGEGQAERRTPQHTVGRKGHTGNSC